MAGEMLLILAAVLVPAAAAVLIWNYRRTKNTFAAIEAMLVEAMDGNFTEGSFDESSLSALEVRFARFLSAVGISAQNVAAERDKIKALISDISHQTKTPVANLLLYSELLSECDLTCPTRRGRTWPPSTGRRNGCVSSSTLW